MSPRVRVVQLSAPVLAALACGDLARATTVGRVHLSAWFVGPECRGVRRMRNQQVRDGDAGGTDNTASAQLALQYGFVPTGEQWDAEDGWEIVYEVAAQAWTTGRHGGRA